MKPMIDRRWPLTILAAVLAGSAAVVFAQSSPSDAEAEMQRRIDRAVEMADQTAAQGNAAHGNTAPHIENLPKPAVSASNVDVEALARKLNAVGHPPASSTPALLAFVSFSMPKASLARMVVDAETYGATLVLRGLVNRNLKQTAEAAHVLIGSHKVGWTIDPQAFKRFDIQSVPSYVLLHANALPHACALRECFDDGDYARLSGDVSVSYALDRIASVAPGFERDAASISGKEARP